MSEQDKYFEADYFFMGMIEEQEDSKNFAFNLSAFLSAARSVMQYGYSEVNPGENSKAKPGGMSWYDGHMIASPILQFFRDKRDINIHVEPIDLQKDIHFKVTETIRISDSGSGIVTGRNGKKVIKSIPIKSERKKKKPESSVTSKISYKFSDWPGKEDVLTLCAKYLQELEKFINEGVKKGFITG